MANINSDQSYSQLFIDDGLAPEQAKKRYKARRGCLLSQLEGITVIQSAMVGPGNGYGWALSAPAVFQEPFFLFLTGINQLNTILLLNPFDKKCPETLFVPEKDLKMEFWEGPRLGTGAAKYDTEIKRLTGISSIQPISSFDTYLVELLASLPKPQSKTLGCYWFQSPKNPKKKIEDSHFKFKQDLSKLCRNVKSKPQLVNIFSLQFPLRLGLDPTDKTNMKVAQQKTTAAFKETLSQWASLKSETDIAAVLDGAIARQSWYRNSFPSIVAGGQNAAILHYTKNNSRISPSSMVLMDFGVRWHGVNSDVSRTLPKNGRFNPLQALLYTIVLDAQILVQSQVKAGVTFNQLNTLCWDFINSELQAKLIAKGGKMNLPYAQAPHNVGHLLAHQVHDGDPFRDYKSEPLQAGWVITNEPGLYGEFSLRIEGTLYKESLGIRIEDNLLVSASGCRNLSTAPKTIEALEALIIPSKH